MVGRGECRGKRDETVLDSVLRTCVFERMPENWQRLCDLCCHSATLAAASTGYWQLALVGSVALIALAEEGRKTVEI